MDTLEKQIKHLALQAKEASTHLGIADIDTRNHALALMAQALRDQTPAILTQNALDVEHAQDTHVKDSLIDRLLLSAERIQDMASALEDLIKLDDPLNKVLENRTLYNGMNLKKVTVPFGVVAVVYEARPNVTADAAGICLKSGNAVILRGGSLAEHSNKIIADILSSAVVAAGLPAACVTCIESTDRAATDVLMQLHGIVDVLVPRGGAGLIQHCVQTSKVPVIETGTGNCHVYVHESADLSMAFDIVMNAKTRRYGVCNAEESLLVDQAVAFEFLSKILPALSDKGVRIHADAETIQLLGNELSMDLATEDDWATEYLGPEIAVRIVDGIETALDHINTYGTKHSEAIVAQDLSAQSRFFQCIDAACVYANASTAFTDGGQFGLGAEIGISTQKLHVRGPFALEGLTSYKYLISGTGQTRA